jgi:hypothetical protein
VAQISPALRGVLRRHAQVARGSGQGGGNPAGFTPMRFRTPGRPATPSIATSCPIATSSRCSKGSDPRLKNEWVIVSAHLRSRRRRRDADS